MTSDETPAKRGPSVFAILFGILALTAIATWLIPAGRYSTVRYDGLRSALVVEDGVAEKTLPPTQESLRSLGVRAPIKGFVDGSTSKPVAVPGSYQRIAAAPASPLVIVTAPVAGVVAGVDVILFVLVIGGFVGLFNSSGAFDAGLAVLARRLKGREDWLIVIVTTLLAMGGAGFGMEEETLAFYPLLAPVFLAAGYDRLVVLAVILGGSQIGGIGSMTNPFSTIIASAAAGVSWTDGIGQRTLVWALSLALLIAWIIRYGRRVRRDRALSLVGLGEPPATAELHDGPPPALTGRTKLLLLLFALTFAVMIVGVSRLGWWFGEMTALFLGASMVIGLLLPSGRRVEAFIDGSRALLGVALVIGVARAVSVVLTASHIDATVIEWAGSALTGTPPALFLIGAMLFFFAISFFIPSTSGVAVLTMPLIAPIAVQVGAPLSGVVSAYVFGSGMMKVISPSATVLPSAAMVDVPYGAWLRFIAPVLAIVGLMAAATLVLNT